MKVVKQQTEEIIHRLTEKRYSFTPAEDLIHTVETDYRFKNLPCLPGMQKSRC